MSVRIEIKMGSNDMEIIDVCMIGLIHSNTSIVLAPNLQDGVDHRRSEFRRDPSALVNPNDHRESLKDETQCIICCSWEEGTEIHRNAICKWN